MPAAWGVAGEDLADAAVAIGATSSSTRAGAPRRTRLPNWSWPDRYSVPGPAVDLADSAATRPRRSDLRVLILATGIAVATAHGAWGSLGGVGGGQGEADDAAVTDAARIVGHHRVEVGERAAEADEVGVRRSAGGATLSRCGRGERTRKAASVPPEGRLHTARRRPGRGSPARRLRRARSAPAVRRQLAVRSGDAERRRR